MKISISQGPKSNLQSLKKRFGDYLTITERVHRLDERKLPDKISIGCCRIYEDFTEKEIGTEIFSATLDRYIKYMQGNGYVFEKGTFHREEKSISIDLDMSKVSMEDLVEFAGSIRATISFFMFHPSKGDDELAATIYFHA
jgi:hypothetical protein